MCKTLYLRIYPTSTSSDSVIIHLILVFFFFNLIYEKFSFQQLYIKKSLDEKKLYAQLQANKSRPVKKSNFQKKLEEIAKQQKAKRNR